MRSFGSHHGHASCDLGGSDQIVHAEHDVPTRGHIDGVNVDACLGHDERDVTRRARFVQDPDNEHLARAIGDSGRVQSAGGLAAVIGNELDDPAPLTARPVNRLNVDRGIT